MIEVNSFAELRTTKPSKAGEVALLTRYYDKDSSFTGGGMFVGFPQTSNLPADDGGTIALDQGKTFFWKRVVNDPLEINLFHFGGKCDGKTDDSDAFYRNFLWAKNLYTMSDAIGVHIPTGVCYIKPIDFTTLGELPVFAVYGNTRAKGGWRPTVKIISDKSTNTVFKVKARRTILEGLEWDGQATADVANIVGAVQESDISNLQPFFENTCPAGEFCNLFGMKFSNTGGTAIKLIDTLDTKFDQIYSSKTYGKVFDIGWSDTVAGGWNHSTAISWQNSNLQYGYGPCTVNMPRVGQGLVRNVWIEHQRFPGNMDNGQWVVEALSIESSDNPLNMNNSRLSVNGAYFQSGGGMTNDRVAGSTLSGYEKGWIRQETYGMELHDASFRAGYYSGYKITNNTDQDLWVYIGSFNFRRMSATWQIDFLGKRDKAAPTGKLQKPSDMDGMGRRTVTLQRANDKVYADMSQEGKDAILDVRYQKLWSDNAKVWVKLAANSGDTIFNLTATGPTRFEAGDCNLFSSDTRVLTDADEIAALEALFAKGGDYTVPQNRFSIHNGLAGIGANEQGLLTLQTKEGSKPSAKDPAGYITVNINGVDRLMPYF